MTTENDFLLTGAPNALHNYQTEYALLGCILTQNSLMEHIGFLSERHFASGPHAAIYKAMRLSHASGDPITPFTLIIDPESTEIIAAAGGLTRYLSGAVAQSISMLHPISAAKHLIHLAQKRELIAACRKVTDLAVEESDTQTAEEHATSLAADIERILRHTGMPEFQNDYEVTEQILEDLKDDRPPDSTGLRNLDEAMGGGLYPGRSYGFAAKKKIGKTILASTISCNLNIAGIKHLFICGEMSPKEIQQRNLARLTDSFPSAFRNAYGESQNFRDKIAHAANDSKRCMLYHNAPGLTLHELQRVASSALYRHKIKGIILDYWQLVGGKGKGQSTAEHLDDVAQWIADFGRKHGIWMITMAQINQEGNTRGGEGIRLAFDQVYQIHREDISRPETWLEMMDTRYTKWANIGSKHSAGLHMNVKGPFFEE